VIPKKIHYCWFGRGEMPELAKKCLASWVKYLPDYKIIVWNEDNFDINCNQYVREAYQSKKYAFVSDYVRLHALYNHGGIYLDTDVEVLKSFDEFLIHRAFIGFEDNRLCGTGIIASEKGHDWIFDLLEAYNNRRFIRDGGGFDTTPNTLIVTNLTTSKYGLISNNNRQTLTEGVEIYPFDYFCAKDWRTGQVTIGLNTYSVHHYSASWYSKKDKIKMKIRMLLGTRVSNFLRSLMVK
jgi:mannosyltransferase OCH1-like enzyme